MGDGCLLMPEAPPFPFNSAGTLYMHPAPLPSLVVRPARSNTNGFSSAQGRRNEPAGNSTINSSSPPSKDSDETNNTSTDDPSQEQQVEEEEEEEDPSSSPGKPQPCSIADAPLKLVKSDGLLEPPSTGKDNEQEVDKNDDDNSKEEGNQQEN